MADPSYSMARHTDTIPALNASLTNVGGLSIQVDEGWEDEQRHREQPEKDAKSLIAPNRQISDESDLSFVSGLSSAASSRGFHQKRPSMHAKPNWARAEVRRTVFITHQIRVFDEEWEELDFLGDPGQFGQAVKCFRRDDPRRNLFCVKRINKAKFLHIDALARKSVLMTMQNEIWTLQVVDHPNIVKLHDVYEDRNYVHLVLDLCSGGELFERICEVDTFTEFEAARIVRQILLAIEHMHDKDIAHLDLKPENILFADRGPEADIKLIDFGMAQIIPRLQYLSTLTGTPYYMAPEVLKGEYNRAADIWSVGIILFCLIFGYPPFYVDDEDEETFQMGQTLEEKIYANVEGGFIPEIRDDYGPWFPKEMTDGVSQEVMNLIGDMLKSNPADRCTVKQALDSKWIRMEFEDNEIPIGIRDALLTFQKKDKFRVAVSQLFSSTLNPHQIEEVKALFETWDVNGDGVVTFEEFKSGLAETDEFGHLTEDKIEQIFANVDLDGDRKLTISELVTLSAHQILIGADERMMHMFLKLDEDGDGTITADEMRKALEDANLTEFNAEEIIAQADANGDGVVDYEEFLRVLMPQFTQLANDRIVRPLGEHHQLPWEYVDDVGSRLQSKSLSAISKASSNRNSQASSHPPLLNGHALGNNTHQSVSSRSEESSRSLLSDEMLSKLQQVEFDKRALEDHVGSLTTALERKENDFSEIQDAYHGQQDTVRTLQEEIRYLQGELVKTERERGEALNRVETLEKKIGDLESKNTSLEEDVKSMTSDLSDAVVSKMKVLMTTNQEIEYLRSVVHDLGGDYRLRRQRTPNGY